MPEDERRVVLEEDVELLAAAARRDGELLDVLVVRAVERKILTARRAARAAALAVAARAAARRRPRRRPRRRRRSALGSADERLLLLEAREERSSLRACVMALPTERRIASIICTTSSQFSCPNVTVVPAPRPFFFCGRLAPLGGTPNMEPMATPLTDGRPTREAERWTRGLPRPSFFSRSGFDVASRT